MITVVTLCSANYLAHAKTLGESLAEHNPDFHFVIGLVDRWPKEIEPTYCQPFEVIPVEDLGIPEFAEMAQKYDIVELNTAVKPFYMEHLYRRNPAVEAVIYLDPDILVLGSFKPLTEKLRSYSIILTPHSCTYDGTAVNLDYEIRMLAMGIYNLGFIATRRADTTFAFLKWWQRRVRDFCYYRPGSGVFVDQLWVALAPLYFPGVHVETDPGYNMCYWNHFERRLGRQDGRYVVNGGHSLVFHHFSSYNPTKPAAIAKWLSEPTMSFSERPDLQPLYDDYSKRLLSNGYASISSLAYHFAPKPPPLRNAIKVFIQGVLKNLLGILPTSNQRQLRRLARFIADICAK